LYAAQARCRANVGQEAKADLCLSFLIATASLQTHACDYGSILNSRRGGVETGSGDANFLCATHSAIMGNHAPLGVGVEVEISDADELNARGPAHEICFARARCFALFPAGIRRPTAAALAAAIALLTINMPCASPSTAAGRPRPPQARTRIYTDLLIQYSANPRTSSCMRERQRSEHALNQSQQRWRFPAGISTQTSLRSSGFSNPRPTL